MKDSPKIESVTFLQNHRCFNEGETFEELDKPLVLLVGDQGCGKSTLLNMMFRYNQNLNHIKIGMTSNESGVQTFWFDSEQDNPRVQSSLPNDQSKFELRMKTLWKSHGEVMRMYTIDAIKKAKDCIIFLDEPESGLSIRNQFTLVQELKLARERNVQAFVSTHCMPLISSCNYVLSLEHRKWMPSVDFLKTQTK